MSVPFSTGGSVQPNQKLRQLPFGQVDPFAPKKTRLQQQAYQYGKSFAKTGAPQGLDLSDPNVWKPYVSPGLRKYAAGGYTGATNQKKPSQTGSGNATGNPAAGQEQQAQAVDPRDSEYYNTFAKLNFQKTQNLNQLASQSEYAKQDLSTALGRMADQHPKDIQKTNEGFNNSGLFYSGKLGQAQGDLETNYSRSQSDLNQQFQRGEAARQAAIDAINQGYGIDEAAALAQAVDRQIQGDLAAPPPPEATNVSTGGVKGSTPQGSAQAATTAATTGLKGDALRAYIFGQQARAQGQTNLSAKDFAKKYNISAGLRQYAEAGSKGTAPPKKKAKK